MSTIREELERIRRMADPKPGERNMSGVVMKTIGMGNAFGIPRVARSVASDEMLKRLWFESGCCLSKTARLAGYPGTRTCKDRLRALGLLAGYHRP